MNLTEEINRQREEILKDFEAIGFKQTHAIHWAIDFPEENKKTFQFPNMSFYPEIVQHDGVSIWFKFRVHFSESEREIILGFLLEKMKGLKYKPVKNKGIPDWINHFNVSYLGIFTPMRQLLEISNYHPLYGNYECNFFISPDYPELVLKQDTQYDFEKR